MPNGGPVIAGYEVLGQLGSGATGTVYLARQISTGRMVAVKALADEVAGRVGWLERFRSEARLMTRFDDEHLVNVYDYLEDGGSAYLVMEYVPGVSLRELIRRDNRFSPEQALGVLAGALKGLAAAHRLGVVHGDLKPENVIVTPEGLSRLVDFGQASPLGSLPSGGTPAYASPEALRDESVDARSDVYAAGLLVYELITGVPPFSGGAGEVAAAHRDRTPPRLEGVPEPLADLIACSLSKYPEDRPTSAEAFLSELESVATASYGPNWRARASIAAFAGGLAGAATAALATAAPQSPGGAVRATRTVARRAHPADRLRTFASRGRIAVSGHRVVSVTAAAVVVVASVASFVLGSSPAIAGPFTAASISANASGVTCNGAHCLIDLGSAVLAVAPSGRRELSQLPAGAGTVSDISCPSARWCMAVGSTPAGGGLSLVSANAGRTWRSIAVPAAAGGLIAVSCAPRSRACWATAHTGLVHSLGGGAWRLQRAPSNVGGFGAISCATTRSCVAFAGSDPLWTRDGGRIWKAEAGLALLYATTSLDCVTASTCWSVGEYTNSLQSQIGAVFRTSDGGVTWMRVGIPLKPRPYGLDSVSCWSTSSCLVDGTVEMGGLESSSGTPYFLATSDGGAHWRLHFPPETMPYVPALSCTSDRRCVLAGRSGVGITTDDGETWRPLTYSSALSMEALSCTRRTGCYVAGSFPHMTKGHLGAFIVLNATPVAALARIGSAGRAWSLGTTDRHATRFSALSCATGAPGTRCFAIAVATNNTDTLVSLRPAVGQAAPIPLPTTPVSLNGVSCPTTSTCWVTAGVTGGSILWRRTRSSWLEVPLPAGLGSLAALSCTSATRCLVAGSVGGAPVLVEVNLASRRSDWSIALLPHTLQTLSAVECPETSLCWIAGTGSARSSASSPSAGPQPVMYRTTDLAATTHPIRPGTSLVSAIAETARSTGGSASAWKVQSLPGGLTSVSSVGCKSVSVCFAVGTLSSGVEILLDAGVGLTALGGALVPPT